MNENFDDFFKYDDPVLELSLNYDYSVQFYNFDEYMKDENIYSNIDSSQIKSTTISSNSSKEKQDYKPQQKLNENTILKEKGEKDIVISIKGENSFLENEAQNFENIHDNIKIGKKRSKYDDDNTSQKIRGMLLKRLRNIINKIYRKIMHKNGHQINKDFILRIDSNNYKFSNKNKNLAFLELKIKDLFSKSLSGLYSEDNPRNYNQKNIEDFYKNCKNYEGSEALIKILDKTVEEMLNSYVKGDEQDNEFNLENDLNQIREKEKMKKTENLENYIETLRQMAANYRFIFNRKIEKKSKK